MSGPLERPNADGKSVTEPEYARPNGLDHPSLRCLLDLGHSRPILITTIDAEEDFDWSAPFSADAIAVASMKHQHIAHRVFQRHGVVPTYLVDFPVASQADGFTPLLELLQSGACEIGAQLHPWVTPPREENVSTYTSFLKNLSPKLQYEKIKVLKSEIEQRFAISPSVFRAGRYGIGSETINILRDLDFKIDTSVSPRWDFRPEGGPDFTASNPGAYWIDATRSMLELPLSCDFVGRRVFRSVSLGRLVLSRLGHSLHLPGAMARLGLMERIKLTPEGVTLDEAKRLTTTMLADGRKVFVLSYHSPSLLPGNTPYVRNRSDLYQFLQWLDGYFEFFLEEIGGECLSANDFFVAISEMQNDIPLIPNTSSYQQPL